MRHSAAARASCVCGYPRLLLDHALHHELVDFRADDDGAVGVPVLVQVEVILIAAHLCDLRDGSVLASSGLMNPQIRFGEDLMSRVSYVMMNPGGDVHQFQQHAVRQVHDAKADPAPSASIIGLFAFKPCSNAISLRARALSPTRSRATTNP